MLPNGFQLEFTRRAMACDFQFLLGPDAPPSTSEVVMEAFRVIDDLESKLSIYRPDSELSLANQTASQAPLVVSERTSKLIAIAIDAYHATSGAFDLTAASLSEIWGFSRREGRMPSQQEIDEALQRIGTPHLGWNPSQKSIRFLRPGLMLNPGGIGKGYALDCAADLLRDAEIPNFLIHGGQSSCLVRGRQEEESEGWRIAVRHPIQTECLLGELNLCDQALATSGTAKQFFYYQGKRYCHILDPRTGWPAQHWLGVTTIAATAALADAYATAAFVMSELELQAFCQAHPEVGVVAIGAGQRQGGVQIVTHNLADQTWRQLVRD